MRFFELWAFDYYIDLAITLVAYFVSNHAVLGDDEESLKEAIPPIILRTASIIVSNPVCANCRNFIKQVNTVLDLDLQATRVWVEAELKYGIVECNFLPSHEHECSWHWVNDRFCLWYKLHKPVLGESEDSDSYQADAASIMYQGSDC
jgi:hypothetical protein